MGDDFLFNVISFGKLPPGLCGFLHRTPQMIHSHSCLIGDVTQTIHQGWAMTLLCDPRSDFDISSSLMLHRQGVEAHPPSIALWTARLLNAIQVGWDCFTFLVFWSFSVNKNLNSLQRSTLFTERLVSLLQCPAYSWDFVYYKDLSDLPKEQALPVVISAKVTYSAWTVPQIHLRLHETHYT